MKIEFLNDDMTEARLTRGWFRKFTTLVTFDRTKAHNWRYAITGRSVERHIARRLDIRREWGINHDRDWQPLRTLPKARMLE